MNLSVWKRLFRTPFGIPLGMSILLQGSLFALVIPLVPVLISQHIGLTKPQVTQYFLINTTVSVIVVLVTGYLSDGAIARHWLILIGGIIAALGYLGLATAALPIHAYLAGATTVAISVQFPQYFAVAKLRLLADWEREAQVVGITALRTLFSFGFIFGTAVSSWLAQAWEINTVFLLIASTALVLTLYGAYIVRRMEQSAPPPEATGSAAAAAAATPAPSTQLTALVVPLIALIVLRGAHSTQGSYLPLVMLQLFNDPGVAPVMFGITAAAELVTMGLVGYLASRIGEKAAISVGAIFGAVSFVMVATSQSLPVLYFAHVLYAMFVAALLGVAMAYIQGLMANRVGMGGSLYMATMSVGTYIGVLSPLLVTGYDQRIFIIPALLCLTGAALLTFGSRSRRVKLSAAAPEPEPAPAAQATIT